MVYWDPVPEANRHGIITGYHVNISLLQNRVASFFENVTTGDLFREYTELESYQNYSIEIAAKTVELGNYSEPIFIMTGEAGNDLRITRLTTYCSYWNVTLFIHSVIPHPPPPTPTV